jgi:fatty-acyl-CoA synthase
LAVSFAPLDRGIEIDRVDANRLQWDRAVVPVIADRERIVGRARDLVLCGRPLPEVAVEIRDDAGAPLADRVVGRIFVNGKSVMAGYLNDPAETARTLSRDGWLDTGDLGYWLDGVIVIVGRHKDLIIVNGRNIAPHDLEWIAEQVPGVRPGDVAAFSIDDADTGERVVLVVECRFHESAARKVLSKAIVGAVHSAAAVECDVLLVPPRSLPYTSSGKLSRSLTKHKFLRGEYAPSDAAVRLKIEPAVAYTR